MNFIFDINRAREHLKNCINAGEVKQFPLLNIYQRVISNRNNATSQDRNKKHNETEIIDVENSKRINKAKSHESTQMTTTVYNNNNMEKKNAKTIRASDLNTNDSQDNIKTLLQNYFHDQKQKMISKRKHSPDPKMEIHNDKPVNKTVKDKVKDRERKQINLKNMSSEDKKVFNMKKVNK